MEIKVHSEIGKLKKVLVHRPGKEVERIHPELFEKLLFDDIMHLEVAQKEHDAFTDALRNEGVEVFYIEKLTAEVLDLDAKYREKFINEYLELSGITNKTVYMEAKKYLDSIKNNLELVNATIAGITKDDIKPKFGTSLQDMHEADDDYPFYAEPIPNILFQRDPMVSVYNGAHINNMWSIVRKRENIYTQYVYNYHPEFKDVPRFSEDETPTNPGTIEGGDVLVINNETLFIALSQRTNAIGVEEFAKSAFKKFSNLKQILAIEIPKSRSTMHLDTIMTQMDYDKFSIDTDAAQEVFTYYEIKKDGATKKAAKMEEILKTFVSPDVKLYIVGDGRKIAAKREQWNDGANCLTIAPNTIVVYDRNTYTNNLLEKAGVKLIKVPSSELSRGRGGPRCMSMPLEREEI